MNQVEASTMKVWGSQYSTIPKITIIGILNKAFITGHQEYMFLLAGNIMPGAEKLWGKLLFPEEKNVVFFDLNLILIYMFIV